MPQFAPDQVTFRDTPGYGAWDIGHAREHIQFVQVLAGQNPTIAISDYNMLSFFTAGSAAPSIIQSHSSVHNQLRAALGITGVDLSVLNLNDEGSFYDWLGYHSTEHAQIRQLLNLT